MNPGALLAGMGLGAGLAYLLDPVESGRRRARVRDRIAHAATATRKAMGTTSRDLRNRITGTAARAASVVRGDHADDERLEAQVRSALGRVVSHPRAVHVTVANAVVTLRGPILAAEADRLIATVQRLRGVRQVTDELERHKQAGDVPSLQGGAGRSGPQPDFLQRRWSPATRLVAGTAGAILTGYGTSRRDMSGWVSVAGGLLLLGRAASNLDLRRMTGMRAGRRAVDVQKTITIHAPIDAVFRYLASPENFPRFMSRVLEVRPSTREQQTRWTVAGPAGTTVEFDSEIVQRVENVMLAWRTVEGSVIGHAGVVQFEPTAEGGTRVHIRMSYNPPGGWIGHGIAAAFGVDPKNSLDADLLRLKTLLETGRPARDAARRDVH